jgi:nucleotide-binding universal stress UspA family protein
MSTFHPKHILCPTDFSEHSAAALRVAGGMAKAFGARVIVFHAQRMEVPIYFTAAQTQVLRAQLQRSARAAWGFVNDFAKQHLPAEVEHSVLLMEDDPVQAILTVLKDLRAGLVVMGTHGRTGIARLRLGSVSESVLRQVSVPVLTVGPRIKPTPALATIRRVLCPVNYLDLARTALQHAAALAEKTGAELVVAHVQENLLPRAESEGKDPLQELYDWVPAEVRSRCAVKEVVKVGTAAEQIVAEAKASHIDCIVVGGQPRSFMGTILFGSTTELVIRNAPCPVLSVIRK